MSTTAPPSRFRIVPDFPRYCVNRYGTVMSSARGFRRPLRVFTDTRGYPAVNLCHKGCRRRVNVHTLVLLAFVGPCPEGHECRHLDGRKENCALFNLAWGTRCENAADRRRHGTAPTGTANGRAKLTDDDAREVMRLYRSELPDRAALARRFNVSWFAIDRIVSGRGRMHLALAA